MDVDIAEDAFLLTLLYRAEVAAKLRAAHLTAPKHMCTTGNNRIRDNSAVTHQVRQIRQILLIIGILVIHFYR